MANKAVSPVIMVYQSADGAAYDLMMSYYDDPHRIENSIRAGRPWLMLDKAGRFERKVEEQYKAFYMGFWELANGSACRIFFQPEPRLDLAHSHFFGIVIRPGPIDYAEEIYIINGKSAFESPMAGIMNPSTAEVIISQSNHDFRAFRGGGNTYIDGGRVYTRIVGDLATVIRGQVSLTSGIDFRWTLN
jgi:hypothetical protein